MTDAFLAARAFFADEGIPFPPIPDSMAPRVAAVRPLEWGFGGPDTHLVDREGYLRFVEADPAAEFLRFGRAGYSATSDCVALHAGIGRVAVVVQVQWGGYEFDLASSAESARRVWTALELLIEAGAAPAPDGPRVLAVSSSFELGARFAVLGSDGDPDWYRAAKATVFDDALAALTRA